jgi:glycosyltransferase involved in cell wall biosynthesis
MHISLLVLLIIPYLIIISLLIYGWFRKQKPKTGVSENPLVSVLIPVKNEEATLPLLLHDLSLQTYSNFEIIIIDDHSEDGTITNLQSHISGKTSVLSLKANSGKKAALWEGILSAKGEYLITTDGDCRVSEGWLAAMVDYFNKFPMHLIIGPVFLNEKKGLFHRFQSLEFLSLIASGSGAVGIGHPILCNGANLGAHKSLFKKARDVYHSGITSGDDIFLLQKLKTLGYPSVFVKSNNAVVVTRSAGKFNNFFDQRTRWTFKSRFYKDPDIITTAILVLLTNVFLVGMLFYSLVYPQFFDDFFLLYISKCFVDYALLYYVARFFNRKHLLKYFFIHQLLYIFYISVVGFAGHFASGKWKGIKGNKF